MSKSLTQDQKTEISKSTLNNKTIITIDLSSEQGGPLRILANDTVASAVINEQTYLTELVKASPIETSLDGTVDRMTISISDIEQKYSGKIANKGDVFTNVECKIEEVLVSQNVGWTPSKITTELWLDAADVNTISKDGNNKVSQWNDKSGNSIHLSQENSDYKPTYNTNTNSIDFDGINDNLQSASLNSSDLTSNNGTVFNLFSVVAFTSGVNWFNFEETPSRRINFETNDRWDWVNDQAGKLENWSDTLTSTHKIISAVADGTNQYVRLNGDQVASKANSLSLASFNSSITLGKSTTLNYWANCSFKELLLVPNSLSNSDIEKIEGYLAWKWGLTGNLPIDHPYKSDGSLFGYWTPSQVTETCAWYDAADIATITKDGSNNVSQWNDKSGNSVDISQTNPTYKPIYDSTDKSVNFDADYFYAYVSAIAGIAVLRNINGKVGSNWVTPIIGQRGDQTPPSYIFVNTGEDAATYVASIDGASANTGDISLNGGDLTPGNGTGTNISISGYTHFPVNDEPDVLYWQLNQTELWRFIATYTDEYNNAGKFDMHELILFSSIPSDSDRQKIEGYLAHKWGFASKLPAGHPYKSSSPSTVSTSQTVGDPILLFDGVINNVKANPRALSFNVERPLNNYSSLSPNMIYDVNCQFMFKGTKCGYSGEEAKCNKTLANCQELGNQQNFGGFPSVVVPTPTK